MLVQTVGILKKTMYETYVNSLYLVFKVFSVAVIILIFWHIWSAITPKEGMAIAMYIMLAELFDKSYPRQYWAITSEIKSGRIDNRMIRPASIIWQLFVESWGEFALTFSVAFIILYLIVNQTTGYVFNLLDVALGATLFGLAVFPTHVIIGLLTVWVGDSRPINNLYHKIEMIFQLIPMYKFNIAKFLPQYYVYTVPARVTQGFGVDASYWVTLTMLYAVLFWIYKQAMVKMYVFGG